MSPEGQTIVLTIVMAIVTALVSAVWWFARQNSARQDAQITEIWRQFNGLKEKVLEEYVSYERLAELLRPMASDIHDIKETLRRGSD